MASAADKAILAGLGILIAHDPTQIKFGALTFDALFIQDPERLQMLAAGYDERADAKAIARVADFKGTKLPTNRDYLTVDGHEWKVTDVLANGAFVEFTLHRHG